MLDFNHVVNAPGFNVQTFYGNTTATTLREWQTWIKPRGSRMLWLIAVGGGGSGSSSGTVAATAGGGGGGGSGSQSSVIIPSSMVPDVLYIQAGTGGRVVTPAGNGVGIAGTITYVSIEPNTTLTTNNTILFANGGAGGAAAAGTTGGAGGAGGTVATLANMPSAGRGIYQFFAGHSGTSGGLTIISTTGTIGTITGTGPWTATITGMTSTTGLAVGNRISATNGTGSLGAGGTYVVASIISATSITYTATGGTTPTAGTVTNITSITGLALTLPTTGLMVTGGTGGGGKTTTFSAGGQITGSGQGEFLPTVEGGTAPGTTGGAGSTLIARNFLMNYGGTGGGSATNTAGGNAGAGAIGSPGSGGGGAGASSTNASVLSRPGDGGPGFVIVISW